MNDVAWGRTKQSPGDKEKLSCFCHLKIIKNLPLFRVQMEIFVVQDRSDVAFTSLLRTAGIGIIFLINYIWCCIYEGNGIIYSYNFIDALNIF